MIGYYANDPQDVVPAMYDDCGLEIYPGEPYWVTADGDVYSEESWKNMKREAIDDEEMATVIEEGRMRVAY